jgi:predicted DNA-binding transcriptional regulator AlpA
MPPASAGNQTVSIYSTGAGDVGDRLFVRGHDILDEAIGIADVMLMLGVSEATVWRMVRSGRLPKPFYPSPRAARWTRGEIRQTRNQLRMLPEEALRARLRKSQGEPIAG